MSSLIKHKVWTMIPSLYDGGAEKFTADLSLHLSNVFNYATLVYNPTENKYNHSGKLIELDVPQSSGILARLWRQLKILRTLKKLKAVEKPFVTISHMMMANMLNIISNKNGITICVLHGEWSVKTKRFAILNQLVKRYYGKADIIISVSHYIKNMFDANYDLDVPHEVIYVRVPIEEIEKKAAEVPEIQLPENYLVYVAGFRPVKNHIKLIDHLANYLTKNDVSLVMVGDGLLRLKIERHILEKNLSEKIMLVGNLTNPYPVIRNAKLSLVVSSSESFSLVVVESMVLGVPVIATDCGGPREIIAPNWNEDTELPYVSDVGILIPNAKDWKMDTLSSEIDVLLANTDSYKMISENAKVRARDFSIEQSEKEYEALIKRLIENNN